MSRTLLLNGGKIIELECRLKAPNGIQHGEVVVTSGGRLNCQFIVHGACCPWDGGAGTSEMVYLIISVTPPAVADLVFPGTSK